MKLSMVTVCRNAESCIERTIKSVLDQNEPVYEYIVIDGGSSDSTYSIVKKYAPIFREKGIAYKTISEPDRGISDAFNKGINLATGDLVGLINADDELMPGTCELLRRSYEANSADIFYGNCLWCNPAQNMEYISKPKHEYRKLLYYMILIHPSTFIKKSVYDECGGYNITYKYCMDKELLYRMYKCGKTFYYIDETLTKFKAGGISDTNTRAVYKEGSRMAIENGEPVVKVKLIEVKKTIRHTGVVFAKKIGIYRMIKRI